MKSFILPAFVFIITLPCFGQQDSEGFVVVKSDPPFEVHERWVEFPGKALNETTRELKSEFNVRASLYEIVAFLKDETQIQSWQGHVSVYKIYHKADTNQWDEYSRHDIPWPVSDQDSFMEYTVTELQPGLHLLINFRSKVDHSVAPLIEDVNRIELIGCWKLEQVSTDTVKVTYRIQAAPGTNLPRIIVDPFIRNNLLTSMKSMRELIEK